ncbi:MAG: hypothetical protein COV75_03180 [Candidatus Omnitrophica bacterium CG11_big_fil_rev_8_21_14_0_20_63_9]|nr:MAG: hypothetical protein COV75_03180 [Candidatus Omnitrophica bacterium CG11_big_fil_rev_8_21_14_0_20_63_9]
MSLIDEALRRVKDPVVEDTRTSPGKASAPAAPAATPAPAPAHSWSAAPGASPARPAAAADGPSTRMLTVVALAVFALTILLILGGVSSIRRTMAVSPAGTAADASAADPQSSHTDALTPSVLNAPSLAHSVAPAASPAPTHLVLSGVVEGLGEPYAVINGSIVGIGERVAGLELTSISDGLVTLKRSNGEELTLQVAR